jgi:hypothetical protein
MQMPAIGQSTEVTEPSLSALRTPEVSASGQLDFLVQQAMVLAGAAGAAIALETDGEIVCRARSGNAAPDIGAILDRNSGVSGHCITFGEAVVCSDSELDKRVNAAACKALGVRSILVCPLKKSGKVIGILEVLAREPHAVTPATACKLDPVVDSIVAVINPSEANSEQESKAVTPEPGEPNADPAHPNVMETFLAELESDSRTAQTSRPVPPLVAVPQSTSKVQR